MSHQPTRINPVQQQFVTNMKRLQRALTEPLFAVDDLIIVRKSRLLAILLIVMIVIFLCLDSIQVLTVAGYRPPWYGYLFLGTAYILNRTSSYRLAAGMTIAMFPIVIFVSILSSPTSSSYPIIHYLVLSLFIASIFASRQSVVLLAAINLAGIGMLPILLPIALPSYMLLLTPLAINTIGTGLVLVFMQHRDQLEQDRQITLSDSEERLRLALNAAHMGTWSWDIHTDNLLWSSQTAQLFGLTAETLSITYPTYLELIHPDDRATIEEAVAATLAGKIGDFSVDHRIICPNGSLCWIEGKGRLYYDETGQPRRMIGTVIDISARKQAEAAREQAEAARARSEQLFRALIDDCADAVALFNVDGFVQYASPATERILGYRLDFYAGQDVSDFIHPDDLEQVMERLGQLMLQPMGRSTIEVRIRHQDGNWRWIEATAVNSLSDPAIAGIVVNFHDMTERKQAEAALRENEERYRMISELVSDFAFAYHRAEGGGMLLAWVTDAFTRITGYTIEEMREPAQWFAIIHPDDLPIAQQHADLLFTGQAQVNECRVIARDGRILWLRLYGHPVWDATTRRVVRIYGAAQNITTIKELEQQLRQAQKMEAIGLLAGGIAHDFNNLLTIILGNTAILLDGEPNPHTFQHDIEQIDAAAARAAGLTRQLLAFSRQQVLAPRLLNLNTIVLGVEPLLRRLIGEDITLVMQLAPDLGLLKADAGQLEQVIMNLVINARDAMPEGGTLMITTANVAKHEPAALQYPSRLSAPLAHMSNSREQSPAITLIISDTGIGMNASTCARIFEPFYTTKAIGKGTGLGLAIVHGIVTQSGGQISVDSEPGCGAAFTICLPCADASIEEVSSVDPPALDIHKAATILLVEDDLIVRTLAGRILRKQGYHIIEAGDGPTALQAVATYQEQIHVLLTDVGIPGGINGYQLAEQITALHPMIKVLYMSGYAEPALSQAHKIAHHSFVEKPFTPAKLAHTVSIAIRGLST